MTTPVVPKIEIPPTMPNRGLRVRAAKASPPGTEISTSKSTPPPVSAAASPSAARIIWRGTGLMAASPGATGKPGKVTVPTPAPARKITPWPAARRRTTTTMTAPWVTSGSSPASLTTAAIARSPSRQ